MSREFLTGPFRHGLTFIATLAFVVSFFGARLFATLFPATVVTASSSQGTIHFHHFWYGLALIFAAGWMGIAWRNERLYRLYAVLDLRQLPVRAYVPVLHRCHILCNNSDAPLAVQGPAGGGASQAEPSRADI